MAKLQIVVRGPRGAGKTTVMMLIKEALGVYDIDCQSQICEAMDCENITVQLSRNDLKALAERHVGKK